MSSRRAMRAATIPVSTSPETPQGFDRDGDAMACKRCGVRLPLNSGPSLMRAHTVRCIGDEPL